MQVRFVRPVVLVAAMSVAAGACGKYSISNIRSAKAFQDANALYKKNDFKGAAVRYEDAVSFNPDLGFAYFFLGNSYDNLYKPGKKGDPENDANLPKAAGHYRTAIDKLATATDPKEKQIRRYSFEYLMALYGPDKLNDFSKAEPVAKELIAVDPNDSSTYQVLAKLYEDQGRFDEAEAQYRKAIDVNPKEPTGYQIIARFYNDRGDFTKTMEAWHKRAEIEPNNPEAWHTIGVYYQDKVFKDKKLNSKVALDYVLKGLEAENKALSINADYFEAMTYKNILLRQEALYVKDPKQQKDLLAEAEKLYAAAMELRKKQNEAAGTAAPADAAKKSGS
ncbi:MAG TPA: tetratricopeptide repeat protein [Vicinamibacterales bacterium]|nr:tetratricopeptide repeat protein [Vicinamibacterales bacterium]